MTGIEPALSAWESALFGVVCGLTCGAAVAMKKNSPFRYSRRTTRERTDRPFPVKALDPAYVARSQQNAIRRLDAAVLRPVLDSHLTTGGPWWQTHVRERRKDSGRPRCRAEQDPGRSAAIP